MSLIFANTCFKNGAKVIRNIVKSCPFDSERSVGVWRTSGALMDFNLKIIKI